MATATTTTTFRKTTLSHAQKTVLAMSRAQYLDAIRATRPADKLYVGVCIFKMDAHSSRPSVLLLRRSPAAAASNPISSPTHSASRWRRRTRRTSKFSHQQNSSSGSSGREVREGEWFAGSGRISNGDHDHDADDGGGGGDGNGVEINAPCWELPGGKVRDGDFCISAAIARRVAEQTGLRVVRVLGALQDVRRMSEVRILDWDDDGVNIFTDDPADIPDILDGATLTSSTAPTTPTTPTTLGSGGSGSGSGSGSGRNSHRDSRRSPMHSPQLVLRKECLQLNYAVLVQSHDDLAVRSTEHDELVWASFSRIETLHMPEQLKTVIHQGLAFAGEYLF
ncbi:hypothetical protein F4821DRAFT_148252 [Hypoxylon rubiginosum]|uniref:Uncharacterized protein n=1 Tax=Hypoxylon rubiginosum TaxID=110542 RepID=A0ACC0CYJ9_9PEZI|nr:hypothetical protein F4821DRAFT_148252 [Hypoxylon rubiginosum]